MAGQETARSIAFSVRKLVIQPLNAGGGVVLGVPIVVDTAESAELKIDVALDEIRGGAYQFPLAIDPKEMKGELMAKLTDAPPTLIALSTASGYAKVSAPGYVIEQAQLAGASVSSLLTPTVTGAPATGIYAIVATDATHYDVYGLATGIKLAAAILKTANAGVDNTSITGVTLTWTGGNFTVGDGTNVEVNNVGASGVENVMETVTGASAFPLTLPQCQVIVDCTRRAVIYEFHLYYVLFEGIAFPTKQGGYVIPDFKGRIQQPPFGASQVPYRYRRVA